MPVPGKIRCLDAGAGAGAGTGAGRFEKIGAAASASDFLVNRCRCQVRCRFRRHPTK